MFQVNIVLPSGRCESLSLPRSSKVGDLKILAQTYFGQGRFKLITAEGHVLLDPLESIYDAGLEDGDHLTAVACQSQVAATAKAFALWCPGGDRIVSWGNQEFEGLISAFRDQLSVQVVQGPHRHKILFDGEQGTAFAAILADGSVVTWGHPDFGGDSFAVRGQLKNVQQVQATAGAFAAILADGSVVTWGHPDRGGDSSAVRDQLRNVQQVQATAGAFAAILADGSVVTWGDRDAGGDNSAVRDQLRNVQQVQAACGAFAAILADGSVVTWGDPHTGGDSFAVRDQLRNVQQVQATFNAFAAILADGSVVTWGHPDCGGESSAVRDRLRKCAAGSGRLGCIRCRSGRWIGSYMGPPGWWW